MVLKKTKAKLIQSMWFILFQQDKNNGKDLSTYHYGAFLVPRIKAIQLNPADSAQIHMTVFHVSAFAKK